MPQPLSQIPNHGTIFLGNAGVEAFQQRPQLALPAIQVIEAWSTLESFQHGIFVNMLGANPTPAVAMFSALTSGTTQLATLKAVANLYLLEHEKVVFPPILKVVSGAAKRRNKLAHWIWGFASGLPDHVICCSPETVIDMRVKLNLLYDENLKEIPEMPLNSIFAYQKKDFQDDLKEIRLATLLLSKFLMAIKAPNRKPTDVIFDSLKSEPRIRAFLDRPKHGQKNAQAAPE